MTNPFWPGPGVCKWPCREFYEPPYPGNCFITHDAFDTDLSQWAVVSGTPSVSGSYLQLPAGLVQLRTVAEYPRSPANFYQSYCNGWFGFAIDQPGRVSTALTADTTGDYSSGVEARLENERLEVYLNGVLRGWRTVIEGSFGAQLGRLAICSRRDAIVAEVAAGGLVQRVVVPIEYPEAAIPGGAFAYIDKDTPGLVQLDTFQYNFTADAAVAPQCPNCFGEVQQCGTYCAAGSTKRFAVVTLPDITDNDCVCDALDGLQIVLEQQDAQGNPCYWRNVFDIDLGPPCGVKTIDARLNAGNPWWLQLFFDSFDRMFWESAEPFPRDCSAPMSLTNVPDGFHFSCGSTTVAMADASVIFTDNP